LLKCHSQIGWAALPRYFSLGKTVAIVGKQTNTWRKSGKTCCLKMRLPNEDDAVFDRISQHCHA
jgi:hypothetical protein